MKILENLTTPEFESRIVASTPSGLRAILSKSSKVVELGEAYDSGVVSDDDIRTFVDGLLEKHPYPEMLPQCALTALAVMFETRHGPLAEEYLLDLSRVGTARMRMAGMVARECLMRRKNWSDDKNHRRCQLIDKEIDGVLSEDEETELERLQGEMLAYRHMVAPLPLDDLRKFHQELLESIGFASVIISIDDVCADTAILDRVLSDCAAVGFRLSRNLSNIGVLTGCVSRGKIADLQRVSYVRSVDLDEQRTSDH